MNEQPNDERIEEGRFLLSCLWMEMVKRLLDFVVEHYNLSQEESKDLHDMYGKPGLYRIVLTQE